METIGRYRILRRLAIGGMAEIFLAEQPGPAGFSRQVAIKRILPHRANDQEFVRMFLNEARLVAVLNHPNIVQIYDLGEADGTHFIAMEYVEGYDFGQLLDRYEQQNPGKNSRLPEPLVAHLVMQACVGLNYAHSFRDSRTGKHLGLIHRDISLPNVMMSMDGMVKVLDFGIAKATEQARDIATQAGVLKGKISYMSPEYLVGEQIDSRHDIFALGVVCYEMLTGNKPFRARGELQMMQAIIGQEPQDPRQFNHEISDEMVAILMRMLAKEPSRRFQSCADVEISMQQWLQRYAPQYTLRDAVEYVRAMFNLQGDMPAVATPPTTSQQGGLNNWSSPQQEQTPAVRPKSSITNPLLKEPTNNWVEESTSPHGLPLNSPAPSNDNPWEVPTSYLSLSDVPPATPAVQEQQQLHIQSSTTDPQSTIPLDLDLVERARRGEPPPTSGVPLMGTDTTAHDTEAVPDPAAELLREPSHAPETTAPDHASPEEEEHVSIWWGLFPLLFVMGVAGAWFWWKYSKQADDKDEPLPVARLSDASAGKVVSLNAKGTPQLPVRRVQPVVRRVVKPPAPVRRTVVVAKQGTPPVVRQTGNPAVVPRPAVQGNNGTAVPPRRVIPPVRRVVPVVKRAVVPVVRRPVAVVPRAIPRRRVITIAPPRRAPVIRKPAANTRGELTLRSRPRCAVYAGRRRLGFTPITMGLLPGKHRFVLKKRKPFIALPIRVEIKAGDKLRRTLRIRQGSLKIEVSGKRSKVYVDGNYIGTTPVPALRLYAGFHYVRVVGSGGRRRQKRVFIYSRRRSVLRMKAP